MLSTFTTSESKRSTRLHIRDSGFPFAYRQFGKPFSFPRPINFFPHFLVAIGLQDQNAFHVLAHVLEGVF